MKNNYNLYLADFKDLSLHESGREYCQPGKIINFDIKDYHMFHYIMSGSGTFIYDGITYELKKGDLFYIPQGDTAKYFPSDDDPWYYVWVGFNGTKALRYLKQMNLSSNNPIFHSNKNMELNKLFNELSQQYNHAKYLNIEVLSTFIQIIYRMMLFGNKKEVLLTASETHIKEAKQFIENNFQFNIKVTDIANSLSISPNYLANVFKEELGLSPKTLLTNYRMEKASEYLKETKLKIKDVAKKVGYDNPLHFSSQFKKTYKVSPVLYRKYHKLED